MASDYCSAPASSVDAEHAFLVGHHQVNFMQHNMSSNTFQAKIGLGSWSSTPLSPGIDAASRIIKKQVAEEAAEEPEEPEDSNEASE
ncbi:hypothetical protein P691DRAFT_672970 [Macrolepiota fuliginosa MF-IS2]|uniref:HAT C-terminal dimerisation domain-containing protein n=1 Tax=Macrolepiota fuliginosa MF-IS2 TaxID=1400762 RepID=A0A9P6C0L5_9AGAR|nr:hypothetical protein P691DRAFT_672970 [Macrolepiota fuliginosa MF-IS2]